MGSKYLVIQKFPLVAVFRFVIMIQLAIGKMWNYGMPAMLLNS